ncbi:mandelate racemase/muconate lactonizing enzyme family protein [soil metagenome]
MSGPAAERIVGVEVVRCALPIERPVRIGRTVYLEREYVALRLRTGDGTEGHAIGYTRGLPLDAMVSGLAEGILGCRVSRRASIVDGLVAAHQNASASLGRAFSLIDIALWDALARRAGLPLWRLLGGARSRVPIMVVAGYHASERGADAVVAEVRGLIEDGFRQVKLHTADAALVAQVLEAVGDAARIGIDVGMAWRSLPAALAAARPLDELDLAFIEDPFPPERWRLTGELRVRLRTPLAAGEDAAGKALLTELAGVVDVLRIDATVGGGFGAVLDAASVASARGAAVMTHAFPDLHAHLAGAPAVGMVEMIPDTAGVNPVGRLLARRQIVEAGELRLSEEPGHGAPLDWAAVEAIARSTARFEARDADSETGSEEERGCS